MFKHLRWLLFPFSLLYSLVVGMRNWAYDNQFYKRTSFSFPVVVIGNIAVGGTGKSPMTEYVLRLLQSEMNVAVLSRGYGRKTKGFREVSVQDTAALVGDEPLQIKRKFPANRVFVCENRVQGIQQFADQVDAVLLDDAYQHRSLQGSFYILLIDYASLQEPIISLPAGNFREGLSGAKRADCIVITKCPKVMPDATKFKIESKLKAHSAAPIFYAEIAYQPLQHKSEPAISLDFTAKDAAALLLTGIAKPEPLLAYLRPLFKEIKHMAFADHHAFTKEELQKVGQRFAQIDAEKKIIVTTEKDLQRLPDWFMQQYPIYTVPIEPAFLFDQTAIFNNLVKGAFRR